MLISEFPISNRTKNVLSELGYKTEDDFRDKFLEDIKNIKGLGPKGVMEIREYLHVKFGIVFKPKPKDKKIQNFKETQAVVKHLLGHRENIFWGKEMKTASLLLKIHSFEFLSSIKPNRFVGTLSYYFTEQGKKFLTAQKPTLAVYTNHSEVKTEPETLEAQEEVQLNFKSSGPKSIRDFLSK